MARLPSARGMGQYQAPLDSVQLVPKLLPAVMVTVVRLVPGPSAVTDVTL